MDKKCVLYSVTSPLEKFITQVHQEYPGVIVEADKNLRFYEHFIPLMESGEKNVTIRFRPGKLRLPAPTEGYFLPVYATRPHDANYKQLIGKVEIPDVLVANVDSFPEWAAVQDGFRDVQDMKEGIGDIYQVKLQPEDMLSMYYLLNFHRNKE